MAHTFTDAELEAYLDEDLSADVMSEIEAALRDQTEFGERLKQLIARRDAGVHSLGEIWRRGRLTCPTRQQLGSFLLGVLSEKPADYVRFHLEEIGCRQCQANLDDLKNQEAESSQSETRRRRYFQSSAGYLKKA